MKKARQSTYSLTQAKERSESGILLGNVVNLSCRSIRKNSFYQYGDLIGYSVLFFCVLPTPYKSTSRFSLPGTHAGQNVRCIYLSSWKMCIYLCHYMMHARLAMKFLNVTSTVALVISSRT
jgi:hypothetical protein